MHDETIDLRAIAPSASSTIELPVTLSEARPRLRLLLPAGEAGRPEVVFGGRSWAAKHAWREDDVLICEFDEPLPPGKILLRVRFAPR
jgi:hypothetical protein